MGSLQSICCNNPEQNEKPDNEMNTGKQRTEQEERERMERDELKDEDEDEDEQRKNHNFFLSKKPKPKKVISTEQNSTYVINIQKVFHQSPLLEVEVINSNTIEKGTVFKIDPFGLENSLRKANDGYTYFGFEKESIDNSRPRNYSSTIDYSLKPKESNYEDRYIGLHFQIFFNPSTLQYYMNDLGYGFGTFMKVTYQTDITESALVNIGNSYLVFSYNQDEQGISEQSSFSIQTLPLDKGDKCLYMKVFSGNAKYEPFAFHPKLNKTVYIGRDTECNVMIDDSLLSRYHCTITYQSGGIWAINDGKIKTRDIKLSTNGTWLYLMEERLIDEGMIFKGNQNVFKCHYIKNISNNL